MPSKRIMYVEQKTDSRGQRTLNERGPAMIVEVSFSKTGKTIYADGKTFKKGNGVYGNFFCVEDGNEYWISGVKKRGSNRLFGNAPVVDKTTEESNERETIVRNQLFENPANDPVKPWTDWYEQCQSVRQDTCRNWRDELAVLVGHTFLNFLKAADDDAGCRAELPAFVVEIKDMFEPWQLAEFLEEAQQKRPFNPKFYDLDAQAQRRRWGFTDRLLLERAKQLLLGD